MEFTEVIETTGKVLDGAGVAAIVIGALVGTVRFAAEMARRRDFELSYRTYRRGLGRAILLGLEFLVAADIIRTVAIAPTFANVGVLALIVLVRTFLSYSLELELTGRWPWQSSTAST
ncbi:hypothetical protein BOX37_25550 [Nocardia mangyaensis]|uniref:DUF1622 domain-containing protein n=1 Tax=Nocardia mangyaensis TaxID=2213200 RepID=A0A1J0VXI7_9NOCA|nr:DUF1622 domain-containing protein [Nocardia mangyaensis]APE36734.1 hypothetical protein BOX37_25550 [Nocardia mangyaensis]